MVKNIIRALISRGLRIQRELRRYWINLTNVGVNIERGVEIFEGVKISVTDGGFLYVKANSAISSDVKITVQSGKLTIGNNVFIGNSAIIVARESIAIGDNALIAEYVVIRDQDHRYDAAPMRDAGFNTSPITIENDVWIGSKATVLRGVNIGEHSVIAAHSVVNKNVPSGVVVAGIPARVIKNIN